MGGGRLGAGTAVVGSVDLVIVAADGIAESGGFAVKRFSDNWGERMSVACCSPPSLSGPDAVRTCVSRFWVRSGPCFRDLLGLILPAWLSASDNEARAEPSLNRRIVLPRRCRLLLAGETRPKAPRKAL